MTLVEKVVKTFSFMGRLFKIALGNPGWNLYLFVNSFSGPFYSDFSRPEGIPCSFRNVVVFVAHPSIPQLKLQNLVFSRIFTIQYLKDKVLEVSANLFFLQGHPNPQFQSFAILPTWLPWPSKYHTSHMVFDATVLKILSVGEGWGGGAGGM